MPIKVIELEDINGCRVFINPGGVTAIAEQVNCHRTPGTPEKVVCVHVMSCIFTFYIPIDEIKKLLLG